MGRSSEAWFLVSWGENYGGRVGIDFLGDKNGRSRSKLRREMELGEKGQFLLL